MKKKPSKLLQNGEEKKLKIKRRMIKLKTNKPLTKAPR